MTTGTVLVPDSPYNSTQDSTEAFVLLSFAMSAIPAKQAMWELTSSVQDTINLALVKQLRVLRLDGLQLDSHLFSRGHIGAEVNIAERPATNLPPEAVFLSYSQLHGSLMLRLTFNNTLTKVGDNSRCAVLLRLCLAC